MNIVNNIGAFPPRTGRKAITTRLTISPAKLWLRNTWSSPVPAISAPSPAAAWSMSMARSSAVLNTSLWAYGGNCGNNDLNVIDECNMLCNEYGLDAISVPCTIAAAMELYQRGYIKEEECAGVPLEWGSTRALVEWTKRMGNPETELD